MPLIYPSPPTTGDAVVAQNVGGILSAQRQRAGTAQFLSAVRGEALATTDPHRVYSVSLDSLAAGRLLKAASVVSWRYLLMQHSNAVGEVELTANPDGQDQDPQFLALHETRFSDATLTALDIAQNLQKVKRSKYEVRFLKLPSVYFAGLWLHAADDDLIIPLCDPPAPLKPDVVYTEKQVIAGLRPLARTALGFEQKAARRRPRSSP